MLIQIFVGVPSKVVVSIVMSTSSDGAVDLLASCSMRGKFCMVKDEVRGSILERL